MGRQSFAELHSIVRRVEARLPQNRRSKGTIQRDTRDERRRTKDEEGKTGVRRRRGVAEEFEGNDGDGKRGGEV